MIAVSSHAPDRERHAVALACSTAALWFGRGTVPEEDLIGAALLGAAQALARFDDRDGVAFPTYAIHRIRGAIREELRTWDHLDPPTRASLRRGEVEGSLWLLPPISLDGPLAVIEGKILLADAIADPRVDVEAQVLEQLEPEPPSGDVWVSQALAKLSPEEREAVEWIWWRNGTMVDLARHWGLHWNTVKRRRNNALQKLSRCLTDAAKENIL